MKLPFLSLQIFCTVALSMNLAGQTSGPGDLPRMTHAFTSFGSGLGEGGMALSTHPGLNEIYMDGYADNEYWTALRYEASTGTYVQTYASHIYPRRIMAIDVFDIHPYPGDEIMVILRDGSGFIYRQDTKEQLDSFDTGIKGIETFAHYDFDGDGMEEFAVIGQGGLHLFDSSGSLLQTYSGYDARDMVIGQMDSDPGAELAMNDGTVIDINTGTVQCSWPGEFGWYMELNDFDGDGMEELVYCQEWGYAYAFDVDLCTTKWELYVGNIGAITVGDSNLDGKDELILGENQWGSILSYELDTQALNWSIDNPEHGVDQVRLMDLDSDGDIEVCWSAHGDAFLFVADTGTQTLDWESHRMRGPFHGPVLGDVDGDGVDEIVIASNESNSGYDGGQIAVLEQDTFSAHVSQETMFWSNTHGVQGIQLNDVDGDGIQEIILAGGHGYDGRIEIYDYFPDGTFTLIWNNRNEPQNMTFLAADAFDLDQDGDLDIVGCSGSAGSSASKCFVISYDFNTRNQNWRSAQLANTGDTLSEMIHGDFDGDGDTEVAAMKEDGEVFILGPTLVVEATIPGRFRSMRKGPYIAGHGQSFFLSDHTGLLQARIWNGSQYVMNRSHDFGPATTDGFTFANHEQLLIGSEGRLNIFGLPGGRLIWQSEFYGAGFGRNVVRLANGNFVTSGPSGVFLFSRF